MRDLINASEGGDGRCSGHVFICSLEYQIFILFRQKSKPSGLSRHSAPLFPYYHIFSCRAQQLSPSETHPSMHYLYLLIPCRVTGPPKTKNVILVFTWHFFSYVCSDVQELTCVLSVSITDCLLWQRPADVIDHLLHLTSSSHLGVLMPELWLRKG